MISECKNVLLIVPDHLAFEWAQSESVCKSYGTFGETHIWAQYPIRIWQGKPNYIGTPNPRKPYSIISKTLIFLLQNPRENPKPKITKLRDWRLFWSNWSLDSEDQHPWNIILEDPGMLSYQTLQSFNLLSIDLSLLYLFLNLMFLCANCMLKPC